MTLGSKIRVLRIEKGYSQEFIAEELKVSQSTFSRFESDITPPTIIYLTALAKIFEVNITYFFE